MAAPELTLYSRPGCHLCDEMKLVIGPIAAEFGCAVTEIDISSDPDLEAEFGTDIPVLAINGRKAFKYQLTERQLRRKLARA
jgi:hypothetical protein